jgi:hypothetical protein
MVSKKQERMVSQPATPTFSYGEVERALAQLYGANAVQQTTFRARLKHFRKNRIPWQQPGKGSRQRYTPVDYFQLLIACEFAEFGMDPHLIADIIHRHWRQKRGLFQAIDWTQRFPGDDFHVAIEARFMSWTWEKEWATQTDTEISVGVTGEPVQIWLLKASDMPAYLEALKEGRRFSTFNLSTRVREFERALKVRRESNGSPQA